ncbi:glycoside hydrolase family 2 TIM barrel-domain containing protein [Rufibacter sp. XAAS-G3-1]|uniref:glycoside hydrolase family 2 TIM barrel-domain containing protein n=1 Tax=Rufibacter sp. XAAS-G3-1 TaxID=2729134 RepID=UPI0015E782BC|nr:glycoside hydrolase family 2 TIM barrel-domain containing protein [Rufibacter sp. XAAS-G3-1]
MKDFPAIKNVYVQLTGLVLLCLVFCAGFAQANPRTKTSINSVWQFYKGDIAGFPSQAAKVDWEMVNLPHSWNALDVMDDKPGYYRGIGWYRKSISLSPQYRGKEVFLYFEGANQEVEVYVNGQKAGSHIGGYTRFSIPVTKLLKLADGQNTVNEIAIKVDNKFNEDIPTLTADFTFFGGIYRDVFLVATSPVHFDLEDNASNGIYLTTPAVSKDRASVNLKGRLVNSTSGTRRAQVVTTVWDKDKKQIAQQKTTYRLKPREKLTFGQDLKNIANPQLWSPDSPYLYTVTTQVYDAQNNQLLDEVTNPLGFRWFRFDAAQGFFLNGKPLKLIGASRHQDYQGMGNAVSDALQIKDVKLLKEMGGNFLRVAHYPHDPVILEMCDKLGLLTAVEVPIINTITESEAFATNSKNMHLEMIKQNFNHPSVIIWAYMNEILLRPKYADDKARQQIYFDRITALAQELEDLTRREDPSRYTMIPNHGAFELYKKQRLTDIPMLVGWNLYKGWYSGTLDDFGTYLDRHRKELPTKPLLITEYGADADPRVRSNTPVRFDKSMEYAVQFHQVYLREMMNRPFVAAGMIWNLADFNSEGREESMPHVNNKGITTLNRTPKDIYYYYQAHLLQRPFVKIGSRNWVNRGGLADAQNANTSTQTLQVFTNAEKVQLIVNGRKLGEKSAKEKVAEWQVPFTQGLNTVEALVTINGQEHRDFMEVPFDVQPRQFAAAAQPFEELNVLLGAKRLYIDPTNHQVWLPSQPYQPGSWGSVGGEPYKLQNTARLSYGSDKNIQGTEHDPVYQTQLMGLEQYKLDVPQGSYEVTLHFAELVGGTTKEALPYNLDNTVVQEQSEERIFDVYLNGKLVLENFNIAQEYGYARAAAHRIEVAVAGKEGIQLSFKSKKGQPVLNAVQVRKVY